MRLWHEALLPVLPREQLLGQHRECCALRGLSWGRRHSVVDYVFGYPREALAVYHRRVMGEMRRRGYAVSPCWFSAGYRGKRCEAYIPDMALIERYEAFCPVYTEHDDGYYRECTENLRRKGVRIPRLEQFR